MNRFIKKKQNRLKRKMSVRKHLSGHADRPRVSIFRSNSHIYAQLIDDSNHKTLASHSDTKYKKKKDEKKGDVAMLVGEELGKKILDLKIKNVVFDRNGYKYHGRVRSLAEGLRKAGLQF